MDNETYDEVRRLQKAIEDLRYDMKKEIQQMAQAWREDLYEIRLEIQRARDPR